MPKISFPTTPSDSSVQSVSVASNSPKGQQPSLGIKSIRNVSVLLEATPPSRYRSGIHKSKQDNGTKVIEKEYGFITRPLLKKGVNREASIKNAISQIGSRFDPESLLFFNSLQKTADKYRIVIGLRSPSPDGQINLLQGCPTKNFHMKAKSGALGFIYEDPDKSKVPLEKRDKQQRAIENAKQKGAKAIDLVLSAEQIQFAIKHGSLKGTESPNVYSVHLQGRDMGFYIDPNGRAFDSKGAVKVMTNPPESDGAASEGKAITADYDLFCIIPRKQQSINQRPLESRPRFLRTVDSHNQNIHSKIRALTNPVEKYGEESRDKGNIHFFAETIIEDLNNNVAQEGFSGGRLFWHNDETGNPFTPGFDALDKPIFIIPNNPPQQFHDKNSLMMFYREIELAGYKPEYSPIFGF